MATMTTVVLTDDLDGTEAAETVSFGLDGKQWDIDLSADNAQELRLVLGEYIEHARKAGSVKAKPAGERMDKQLAQDIRNWAAANGMPVASRGRLPHAVVDAYQKAAA